MLLAVDVGNTDITFGLFRESELITRFRVTVKVPRSSDEYGELICAILQQKGYSPEDVNEVIIASVVPKIMYSFTSGIIKYLHCHPLVVGAGIKTGIRIETANPKEIGPDRIVDAVSAYEQYGGPIIVVDFGTATTYDIVTAEGAFLGGVISPGIRISANALWNNTANLPEIEIKCPGVSIAKIRSHQCRQDCFWHDRSVGVHYSKDQRRVRLLGCESCRNRRTWEDHFRAYGRDTGV